MTTKTSGELMERLLTVLTEEVSNIFNIAVDEAVEIYQERRINDLEAAILEIKKWVGVDNKEVMAIIKNVMED